MTRQEVYALIDEEREYQKRWEDEDNFDDSNWRPSDWINFMRRYIRKAEEGTELVGNHKEYELYQMEQIRKIGALSVAAMEHNDTPSRK